MKLAENKKKPQPIRSSQVFRDLIRSGHRFKLKNGWIIQWSQDTTPKISYGISVPSKAGNAVLRNRLKRWNREFFRNLTATHPDLQIQAHLQVREMNNKALKQMVKSDFDEIMNSWVAKVIQK